MRSTFKTMLVAMLAVLALSAVAASAAEAEEAPFFKIAGTRLAEGESKEVTAKAGSATIIVGDLVLKCSLTLTPGAKLLGSSKGNPGNIEATAEFTTCFSSREGCEVVGTIKSSPLLVKLVMSEENKGKLLALLRPRKGTSFMKIKLEEHCAFGQNLTFEGEVVTEIDSGGKPIEVGKEPAETNALSIVIPETRIEHYWELKEGVGKEGKIIFEVVGLGGEVEMGGSFMLELAGSPNWGVFD